ncbi:hypothetical protein [Edwardsiella sp. EA181011]|uniref:hypothetical protein n=1 Tax=Edwardsiella sp. EA181011 TaxID=1578828 RepID=UPI001F3741AE
MSRTPITVLILLSLLPRPGAGQTLSLDGVWQTHDANPPLARPRPCAGRAKPGGRCGFPPTGTARESTTRAPSGISVSLPCRPWRQTAWPR